MDPNGEMVRSGHSGWNLKANLKTGFADRLVAESEHTHAVKGDPRAFALATGRTKLPFSDMGTSEGAAGWEEM